MSQKRVTLNVGGTRYTTTVSTLTRESDSMLARMFSDTWSSSKAPTSSYSTTAGNQNVFNSSEIPDTDSPEGHPDDDDDVIFIDSDGTNFRYILNYLRRGEHVYLPPDRQILEELLVESHYFQLLGLNSLIERKIDYLKLADPQNTELFWQPHVGQKVRWRPEAVDGYWKSVAVAVASFHYQNAQSEAVCGFMQKTQYLPDDMEVIFLRCVACRASTRVSETWRYDMDTLLPIRSVMPAQIMQISATPAALSFGGHSSDCVSVWWSSSMALHIAKSALLPVCS